MGKTTGNGTLLRIFFFLAPVRTFLELEEPISHAYRVTFCDVPYCTILWAVISTSHVLIHLEYFGYPYTFSSQMLSSLLLLQGISHVVYTQSLVDSQTLAGAAW